MALESRGCSAPSTLISRAAALSSGDRCTLVTAFTCTWRNQEEFFRQIVLSYLLASAGTAGAKSHVSVVWIKWPELEVAEVLTHEGAGCEGGWLSDK